MPMRAVQDVYKRQPLKCMDVQTVAAVSIRPDVCTNIMHLSLIHI